VFAPDSYAQCVNEIWVPGRNPACCGRHGDGPIAGDPDCGWLLGVIAAVSVQDKFRQFPDRLCRETPGDNNAGEAPQWLR
jgi:hypothetical protein